MSELRAELAELAELAESMRLWEKLREEATLLQTTVQELKQVVAAKEDRLCTLENILRTKDVEIEGVMDALRIHEKEADSVHVSLDGNKEERGLAHVRVAEHSAAVPSRVGWCMKYLSELPSMKQESHAMILRYVPILAGLACSFSKTGNFSSIFGIITSDHDHKRHLQQLPLSLSVIQHGWINLSSISLCVLPVLLLTHPQQLLYLLGRLPRHLSV